MSCPKKIKDFIITGNYKEGKIIHLLEVNSLTEKKLITETFGLLNEEIKSLDVTQDYVFIIINCVELLNLLCNEKEFTKNEILINRRRIKDAREKLLSHAGKLRNDQLLYAANRLDEISLDKGIKLEDLIKLIRRLIDRKEDFNIIKKLLNTNKNVLTINQNELFDYTFYKAIESINNNTPDIYYYISLLKIFYSSSIDNSKYVKELHRIKENEFSNEIYSIIYGNKRSLSPKQILDKYGIITELQTPNIILPERLSYNQDDFALTIDSAGTIIRDDALSISIDGNNYIVKVHIADPVPSLDKDGILLYQSRNNFSCKYFPDTSLRTLPENFSNEMSLNKDNIRNVVTMTIIIGPDGNIKDYSINLDTIKIRENLTFEECDLLLKNYSNESANRIKNFYEVASILEEKYKHKYVYWDKKENDRIDNIIITHESDKIINECMVLFNYLMAKNACDECFPYNYRTQSQSYIGNLAKKLGVKLDSDAQQVINNLYLRSKYSYLPLYHYGLGLEVYSHSSNPLRRHPDLDNIYYYHGFYFKDIDIVYDLDDHKEIIDYYNQRSVELSLMTSEYVRALKLKKD